MKGWIPKQTTPNSKSHPPTPNQFLLSRYSIPRGDWFSLVSSPHYLAEVVIYVGLALTMGLRNWSWWLVLAFVISNLSWYDLL